MLITAIMFVACLVLFVIAPYMAIKKYYTPRKYSILKNIGLIIIAIVTWPLVPIILAMHTRDKVILSMFWISFLVAAVAFGYWVATHAELILELQRNYLAGYNLNA